MAETTATTQENTPQGGQTAQAGNANQEGSSAAAFSPIETQEEFDNRIKERLHRERAKFADYESIKEKAAKLDELEAANKTELQKMTERAEAAETKLSALEAQAERNAWNAEAAKETGLPLELIADLSASTKDELLEKAKRHAVAITPPSAPYVGSDGKQPHQGQLTNADAFASFAQGFFR